MSEAAGQAGNTAAVQYELSITAEEASQGTAKLLPRNQKRLQVSIPAGVVTGSVVKLTNALQVTDGHPGDILIKIKVKADVPSGDVPSGAAPFGDKPSAESPSAAEASAGGVVEITDNTFENEVIKSSLPVVVDFWAAWCGPCKMMAPVMDAAAEQYQGRFKFCKINVDENPNAAGHFQAMSIPMLLFFRNGQVIDKIVGAIPANQLRDKLDSLL
jgi:thioredoxin 1